MNTRKIIRKAFPAPRVQIVRADGSHHFQKARPWRTWFLRLFRKEFKFFVLPLIFAASYLSAQGPHGTTFQEAQTIQWVKVVNSTTIPVSVIGTVGTTQSGPFAVSVTSGNVDVSGSSVSVSGSTVTVLQGGTWFVNVPGVGVTRVQSDSFVSVTTGTIVDLSTGPLRTFSLYVESMGGAANSWDIRLEGSLSSGTKFTSLLQHTELIGDGETLFSGTSMQPVLFLRTRVEALDIGSASNMRVIWLGVQ